MSPQIIKAQPTYPPISPSEVLLTILNRELDPNIVPAGAVVGPATNDQQQAGVLSVTNAGNSKIDPYTPMLWSRAQIRVLAHDLARVDEIGFHTYGLIHNRRRETVYQASSGHSFLIHNIQVTAGPSSHYDSQVTWEGLMFVQIMIGTQPVS